MPIVMTAEFKITLEAQEKVEEAIREFISEVQANEPGTLLYTSSRDLEDASRYLHYFVFSDEKSEEYHRGTEWVTRFTDVLYPETLDGVKFNRFKEISSTTDWN